MTKQIQKTGENRKVEFVGDIHAECWRDGKMIWTDDIQNVVAYAGIEALFMQLADEYSDPLLINYAALGTGTSTPASTDTELETETFRNTSPITTAEANVLYADAVFEQSEVAGTFREFGFFIDGSAGADTGILWNRVSVNWEKSLEDTLFVRCRFTAVNA